MHLQQGARMGDHASVVGSLHSHETQTGSSDYSQQISNFWETQFEEESVQQKSDELSEEFVVGKTTSNNDDHHHDDRVSSGGDETDSRVPPRSAMIPSGLSPASVARSHAPIREHDDDDAPSIPEISRCASDNSEPSNTGIWSKLHNDERRMSRLRSRLTNFRAAEDGSFSKSSMSIISDVSGGSSSSALPPTQEEARRLCAQSKHTFCNHARSAAADSAKIRHSPPPPPPPSRSPTSISPYQRTTTTDQTQKTANLYEDFDDAAQAVHPDRAGNIAPSTPKRVISRISAVTTFAPGSKHYGFSLDGPSLHEPSGAFVVSDRFQASNDSIDHAILNDSSSRQNINGDDSIDFLSQSERAPRRGVSPKRGGLRRSSSLRSRTRREHSQRSGFGQDSASTGRRGGKRGRSVDQSELLCLDGPSLHEPSEAFVVSDQFQASTNKIENTAFHDSASTSRSSVWQNSKSDSNDDSSSFTHSERGSRGGYPSPRSPRRSPRNGLRQSSRGSSRRAGRRPSLDNNSLNQQRSLERSNRGRRRTLDHDNGHVRGDSAADNCVASDGIDPEERKLKEYHVATNTVPDTSVEGGEIDPEERKLKEHESRQSEENEVPDTHDTSSPSARNAQSSSPPRPGAFSVGESGQERRSRNQIPENFEESFGNFFSPTAVSKPFVPVAAMVVEDIDSEELSQKERRLKEQEVELARKMAQLQAWEEDLVRQREELAISGSARVDLDRSSRSTVLNLGMSGRSTRIDLGKSSRSTRIDLGRSGRSTVDNLGMSGRFIDGGELPVAPFTSSENIIEAEVVVQTTLGTSTRFVDASINSTRRSDFDTTMRSNVSSINNTWASRGKRPYGRSGSIAFSDGSTGYSGDEGSSSLVHSLGSVSSCIVHSVDTVDLHLAEDEMGPGPMRFSRVGERSLEEQLLELREQDRRAYRSVKQMWKDHQDKMRASRNPKNIFELPIEWHLRYLRTYNHKKTGLFNEDRAWGCERKLQQRFATLNVYSLQKQLESKTLFPVPGLKTKEGHDMFYMRPSRYRPGKTKTSAVIDNLCYVMNTMTEKEHAQKEGIGFIACMDTWNMRNFEINYCYQFMMGLQSFMVPVKVQLFLIVNPPAWFGVIWRIMKPMLAPSFRKRVKICNETKISKYLQPGFEVFLPDDMQTGRADTHQMLEDFIAFRRFAEMDICPEGLGREIGPYRLRGQHDDSLSIAHSESSGRGGSSTVSGSALDLDDTTHSHGSLDERYVHPGVRARSRDVGDRLRYDMEDFADDDDGASIGADIDQESLADGEDLKQPARVRTISPRANSPFR